MAERRKRITLPCDCKCCMLVIEKTAWADGDIHYTISVMDARYDHGCNTLWGRIKGAVSLLFGKPVCYNEIYLEGEDAFRKLADGMDGLAKAAPEEMDDL